MRDKTNFHVTEAAKGYTPQNHSAASHRAQQVATEVDRLTASNQRAALGRFTFCLADRLLNRTASQPGLKGGRSGPIRPRLPSPETRLLGKI